MSRPKIRHLTVMSRNTLRLAQLYKDGMRMEELSRSKDAFPAISLTDGYLNLVLLPCLLEGDAAAGLNHFGWHIGDIDKISRVLVAQGTPEPERRTSYGPYPEFRGCDPDGNLFDLSVQDSEKPATEKTASRPKIRHLAMMSRDTIKLAQFYKDSFQMEELNRSPGAIPAVYLSDGYLNLALLPCLLKNDAATGLNHFGWQIDSIETMSQTLVVQGMEAPKMHPSNRPYAEFRGCDPDGNLFDLSVQGFERTGARAQSEGAVPAE